MNLFDRLIICFLLCCLISNIKTNPNADLAYWQEYYRRNMERMALQYRYELNELKLGWHERDFAITAYRNNINSLEATVSFQRQIIRFLTRRLMPQTQNESDQLDEFGEEEYYDALEHHSSHHE